MQATGTPRPRAAATGEDPSGAIRVHVDENGLVREVRVRTLPDELREAERLTLAFDQALTRAHANAYPPAPPPAGADVVRARRPQRPERVSIRPLVEEALRRGHQPVVTSRRRLIGGETGVSSNACVRVALDRTGPSGTPTFDQGWLRQATAKNVAAAITEAFTAAYEQRTGR